MNAQEHTQILSLFPFNEIQLSYETHVHKKVHTAHITMAIPDGLKAYTWMTTNGADNVCYILEISAGRISTIKRTTNNFITRMSYGSIFYGTSFVSNNGCNCFSIEDVLFLKGKNICRNNYLNKLTALNEVFQRNEIENNDVVFGLPSFGEQFYPILNAIHALPYKSSTIHFRYLEGKLTNTAFIMKYIRPRVAMMQEQQNNKVEIFNVVADIDPDIYHLTTHTNGGESVGIACISSYKVSVMMNRIFRNIKENSNLDALEESDDEMDFEDVREEKYLNGLVIAMNCAYNHKFKKWVPLSVVHF